MKKNATTFLVIGGLFLVAILILATRGGSGLLSRSTTNDGGLDGKSMNEMAALAPEFTLARLNGSTISLADYRGDKPVILDFWASWCHNCQRSMPKLSKLYTQYKDDIEIIGINLREKQSTAQRFVDERGISYPIALDAGQIAGQYAVRYTNTHVLINKDGEIVRVVTGDLKETDVTGLIAASK